jgi:hypothetical protein
MQIYDMNPEYNDDLYSGKIVQYIGPTTEQFTKNCFYIWHGNSWEGLTIQDKLVEHNNTSSTKCKFCGAPLVLSKAINGICKCEWCRAENYV